MKPIIISLNKFREYLTEGHEPSEVNFREGQYSQLKELVGKTVTIQMDSGWITVVDTTTGEVIDECPDPEVRMDF